VDAPVSWEVIVLRLGLAAIAGGVVGLERESHGRAAGLRTTMLVCIAAALAMLLSQSLLTQTILPNTVWRPDPARLAAGILTGMGFLGAGAILREGNVVRGLTTAAALWFVTIIGLAFGNGLYSLGIIGLVLAVLILTVLSMAEPLIRRDWYGSVALVVALDGISDDDLRARIEAKGVSIKKVDLEYDLEQRRRRLRFTLKYKRGDVYGLSRKVVEDLTSCPGILNVKWE